MPILDLVSVLSALLSNAPIIGITSILVAIASILGALREKIIPGRSNKVSITITDDNSSIVIQNISKAEAEKILEQFIEQPKTIVRSSAQEKTPPVEPQPIDAENKEKEETGNKDNT